jgi:hypothetical protein
MPALKVKTDHLMKAGIFVTLCVALVASCFGVRANDKTDPDFISNLPAADASAQAAARAAMEQKMYDMDQAEARPSPETNFVAAPVEVPVNEASAAATPVTESPAAEAPVAVAPAVAPATVAPVSAAPVVAAPAPRVSTAPATAAAVATPAQATPVGAFPSSSAGQVRPSNELVTTSGATYKNVEVQKVTSDGIVISYTPAQGGWAMTRINFEDLPPDIRQKYGK